ncbi:hypothetical protein MFM001_06630 [Mycobacterium sp. MFM001]|uniref:DUF2742 domain-containing protein n=1 Tax=Mycobacterium sp. MFM001 TaxID=2049453 RepID=UPI000DA49AA3|nr:DUF2742 domain-containing protein [Mycobacterium sp. MFM001]GBE64201.1 hypothetical protein MFM001_06630 [Mycobacterium sp. MFM001]
MSAAIASQQVSWWAVHEWVQKYLETAEAYPMAGTPAWCLLPDDSREKWAALLDFAQHHALRVETAQQARAQASKAVAAAADWPAVAQEIRRGRGVAYIPRREAS